MNSSGLSIPTTYIKYIQKNKDVYEEVDMYIYQNNRERIMKSIGYAMHITKDSVLDKELVDKHILSELIKSLDESKITIAEINLNSTIYYINDNLNNIEFEWIKIKIVDLCHGIKNIRVIMGYNNIWYPFLYGNKEGNLVIVKSGRKWWNNLDLSSNSVKFQYYHSLETEYEFYDNWHTGYNRHIWYPFDDQYAEMNKLKINKKLKTYTFDWYINEIQEEQMNSLDDNIKKFMNNLNKNTNNLVYGLLILFVILLIFFSIF